MSGLELLTAEEMGLADKLAVAAGVPSLTLMENAGRAVADEAAQMVALGGRIAVLCGPGNNGGDGFVVARLLKEAGYDVRVFALRAVVDLKGDARAMGERWVGRVELIDAFDDFGWGLVIDALFGAGFKGPFDPETHRLIGRALVHAAKFPLLAVDVPSGLDATSGQAWVPCVRATKTVTFFRRKTGHVLHPGREWCHDVVVCDIGIPDHVLAEINPKTSSNVRPAAAELVPRQGLAGSALHKYGRGHAVVVSGPPDRTGAARLGARAALRAGAGLVTIASTADALAVNAAQLTAVMVEGFDAPDGLAKVLADRRRNAVLIGPGCGIGDATRRMVQIAIESGAAVVLDADALTSFEENPEALFELTRGACSEQLADQGAEHEPRVVLTPHEGEFVRLFGELAGAKHERARAAAARSRAMVVLKGPDTVIAEPDGLVVINENAPAWLATAGSGDVLAGLISGLLAQRQIAFNAACYAVWLHGECANQFGPGLIAEDLPEMLPKVLRSL